jgi:hypothetical protein
MITKLLRCTAVLATVLGLSQAAHATTATIDYTDLWYNNPPNSESGWGVNVIQQNNILFVTMFIYGPDNTPRWYVAPNVVSTGQNTFTGALYNVPTGTYFGNPWAGTSPAVQVGNIAFTFGTATQGAMTYSINNVQRTKQIIRQTWAADNLTGHYIGGSVGLGASCGGNGGILIHGELTVAHTQPNINMTVDFITGNGAQGQCSYSGQYGQVGSVGSINNGTFNCTIGGQANALVGTFNVQEIRNTRNGFNGRLSAQDNFCAYSGYFGGVKDVF